MSMRTRLRAAMAALGVCALMAGCASLGDPTPVSSGVGLGEGEARPARVVFPGPGEGDTAEEIVRGFIRSGATSEGDYATSRLYLTDSAAQRWRPESEIVLFSSSTPLTVTGRVSNTVILTGEVEATIDREGRSTQAKPGTKRNLGFRLIRTRGQWRISELPDGFGRWVTMSDVGRLLRPYTVHYLAADRRTLVPDLRWFPRDHLATRLARAQLGPPPAYLGGSVRSAIPGASRLTANSVPVVNGEARVDLTSPAPRARLERENIWAQIVATLLQDPQVRRVSIRMDGGGLDLPGIQAPISNEEQAGFPSPMSDPISRPFVRRGASLLYLPRSSMRQTEPELASPLQIPQAFTAPAVSTNTKEIAAVDPGRGGLSRFRGRTRYEVPDFAVELGAPAYDSRGYLWASGVHRNPRDLHRLWSVNAIADPADSRRNMATAIDALWLGQRRVVQARPSPMGDRVAILHVALDGTDPRIDVTGVVRDQNGRPRSLAAPLRLGPTLGQMSSVVWTGPTSIATLARRVGTTETLRPYLLSLAGEETPLAETPTATSITTAGGDRSLVVTTTSGEIFGRTGSQWVGLGRGTDVLVPGR